MVSIFLNHYCYKPLLYEVLVSQHNCGDVKVWIQFFFGIEYIGIEHIKNIGPV